MTATNNNTFCSILLCENDRIKITDFGVSRLIGDKSTRMTFVGTVAWMAPEVIRHEPYSEKVDVWSYGVVIWELLTQQKPYSVSCVQCTLKECMKSPFQWRFQAIWVVCVYTGCIKSGGLCVNKAIRVL